MFLHIKNRIAKQEVQPETHPEAATGLGDGGEADVGQAAAAVQAQHLELRVAGCKRSHARIRDAGASVKNIDHRFTYWMMWRFRY